MTTKTKAAPAKLSKDEIEARRARRLKQHRDSYKRERAGEEFTDWNPSAVDDAMDHLPPRVAGLVEHLRALQLQNEAEHDAFWARKNALMATASELHTAARQFRNNLENHTEPKHRTHDQFDKADKMDAAAKAAKARVAAHTREIPAFDPRRSLAYVSRKVKGEQTEFVPSNDDLAPYSFDGPLESIATLAADIEKANTEFYAVQDALQPGLDAVDDFKRGLTLRPSSNFNFGALLAVQHGVDGRPLVASVEVPDSVLLDAIKAFAISHAEREMDKAVAKAKANGRTFLSKAERSKRVRALKEKIAKLENILGYFIREAIAQGLSPDIPADLPSQALLGCQPVTTTREKAVYVDVSSHGVRPLN